MTLNFFRDILFDLLNESDDLDVHDIETVDGGYRVTVGDGAVFHIAVTSAAPKDNVVQLFPNRKE